MKHGCRTDGLIRKAERRRTGTEMTLNRKRRSKNLNDRWARSVYPNEISINQQKACKINIHSPLPARIFHGFSSLSLTVRPQSDRRRSSCVTLAWVVITL